MPTCLFVDPKITKYSTRPAGLPIDAVVENTAVNGNVFFTTSQLPDAIYGSDVNLIRNNFAEMVRRLHSFRRGIGLKPPPALIPTVMLGKSQNTHISFPPDANFAKGIGTNHLCSYACFFSNLLDTVRHMQST